MNNIDEKSSFAQAMINLFVGFIYLRFQSKIKFPMLHWCNENDFEIAHFIIFPTKRMLQITNIWKDNY